jgi:hypothetical protein
MVFSGLGTDLHPCADPAAHVKMPFADYLTSAPTLSKMIPGPMSKGLL